MDNNQWNIEWAFSSDDRDLIQSHTRNYQDKEQYCTINDGESSPLPKCYQFECFEDANKDSDLSFMHYINHINPQAPNFKMK